MLQKGDVWNIFKDTMPDDVVVEGVSYPVYTHFADWISFFLLHEDATLSDVEKVEISLHWYRDHVPPNIHAAYAALQQFAACESLPKSKRKKAGAGQAPVFSYLHDSTYLFADFLRYYQMNLQTASLHWFMFTALFEGMPEDSMTKQRIAYRSIHLSNIKGKEERKRIMNIQNAIAIPHAPVPAEAAGDLFW